MSRKLKGRGLHLVTNKQAEPFRVGDPVPFSGIYRVFHVEHRVVHELTLVQGHPFPRCTQCGDAVGFELVHYSPDRAHDQDFRKGLVVYEIPHPDGHGEARKTA